MCGIKFETLRHLGIAALHFLANGRDSRHEHLTLAILAEREAINNNNKTTLKINKAQSYFKS